MLGAGIWQGLTVESAFRAQGTRMNMSFRHAAIAAICGALWTAGALAFDSPADTGRDGDLRQADCAAMQAAACEAKSKKKEKGRAKEDAGSQQQRELLQAAVAALAPQRKGVTDLYTIGVAGWADQDVFYKELDGAFAALGKALPTSNRTLRLVNHPSTSQLPLATRANLAAAVQEVGKVMDRNEDVLILFMTSHGSRDGFALQLPWARPVPLPPADVASILTSAGIKNRVLIVSACYSGIFVKPVANDNTIVITAADATHPSFGCAPGRDWTYFGDAYFNRSLQPGVDFRNAFANAKNLISGWELMDNLQPSNPQGHFGAPLMDKLAPLFATGARP
jgi:hypothetical protein